MALALTASLTQATPLRYRQVDDSGLVLADTVFFIAKTIGANPSPGTQNIPFPNSSSLIPPY